MDILDIVDELLVRALSLLPSSPFTYFIENISVNEYWGYVCYFVPFVEMLAIGEAWIAAIVTFYVYQAVLRWVRAIG